MIKSPAYLIYFPETTTIKRVRCVKFTDSYDNRSLSKLDKNTEFPEYLITYDVRAKDFLHGMGGANNPLSHPTEKKTRSFLPSKILNFVGLITVVLCVQFLLTTLRLLTL